MMGIGVDTRPDLTFFADGTLLAVTRAAGIEIIDTRSGDQTSFWPRVGQSTISAGGPGRVFTGGFSGEILEWDSEAGVVVQSLSGRSSPEVMVFDAAADNLVVGELDGTVSVWDLATGERLYGLPPHPSTVLGLDIDPTGTWVASVDFTGSVQIRALRLDELTRLASERVTRSLEPAECASYLGADFCQQ